MRSVSWLSVAPVKGLKLVSRSEVLLDEWGVAENRRFWLVDAEGRRYGLIRDARLALVEAGYEPDGERLTLRFPDGQEVGGAVELSAEVTTDFYGRPVAGRVVEGPWAAALSGYTGRPLRLVRALEPGAGVDRGRGGVSLVSDASLDALTRTVGAGVDARRFRMLAGIAGCEEHEEDGWIGRDVRVGEAIVRVRGTVGRCAITTQNPETGERDLDTLRAIKDYRGTGAEGGVDFGVYGEVVQSGHVRLGDAVEPG